jgi:hypothetical protein
MRTALWILATAIALTACPDPGASIDIEDARATRLPDGRVAIEVDVRAQERLGKNLGTYCTRVTFTGQADFAEECRSDLEDGDLRTLHFESAIDLDDGALIFVDLHLPDRDARRTLVAPPH